MVWARVSKVFNLLAIGAKYGGLYDKSWLLVGRLYEYETEKFIKPADALQGRIYRTEALLVEANGGGSGIGYTRFAIQLTLTLTGNWVIFDLDIADSGLVVPSAFDGYFKTLTKKTDGYFFNLR